MRVFTPLGGVRANALTYQSCDPAGVPLPQYSQRADFQPVQSGYLFLRLVEQRSSDLDRVYSLMCHALLMWWGAHRVCRWWGEHFPSYYLCLAFRGGDRVALGVLKCWLGGRFPWLNVW